MHRIVLAAERLVDGLKARGGIAGTLVRWGVLPYHAMRRERRPGLVILSYHRVGGQTGSDVDVPARTFERQMRHLRDHHRVVSLDEVITISAQPTERHSDRDVVAVTFDDGFLETYTVAYPILRRYRIPATVYLAAGYVEERRPFDFGMYREMHVAQRPRPLTWEHIAEMISSGFITIGGHTRTHPDLSQISAAECRREIEDCDGLIESRLRVRPKHFAYPFGRWSADAHAVVAAWYETVALSGPGKNPYATLDRSWLWRYPVTQSDGYWLFRTRVRALPPRRRERST